MEIGQEANDRVEYFRIVGYPLDWSFVPSWKSLACALRNQLASKASKTYRGSHCQY
jgi:hypothetical protein